MRYKLLWKTSLTTLIGLYVAAWWFIYPLRQRDGFPCNNGKVETVEFDMVAPKSGWIKQVRVHPGEIVTTGQVVAQMNTQDLETQLRETGIALLKARAAAEEAKNQMTFYRRARAAMLQHPPNHPLPGINLKNDLRQYSDSSPSYDGITWQLLNNDHIVAAEQEQRQQDIINAKNEMAEWRAKIIPIRSQLFAAQSAVITAQTSIEQLQADVAAGVLTAPMTGQVLRQYVKNGDWVAQGDKVLRIMDFQDVNMKFSLPAYHAAALAIGTEIRLVLDLPSPVILPAQISSIAPNTASLFAIWNELVNQQQQIVVKAKIAPELLKTCACDVTGGVTGRAYVRFDKSVQWPTDLSDRCQDCYRLEALRNSKTTTIIGNSILN